MKTKRTTLTLCATAVWLAWIRATAAADIPVFPKRPDWDDTPLPMPPEIVALLVVTLALTIALQLRSARRRD